MVQAPTGTVTLVFTDIEGSTALWEHLGADFQPALDLHDALLRSAIADHDGYEVKTEGDAFMVAFAEATDAVRFCLDVQERLHEADWPSRLLEDRGYGVSQRVAYDAYGEGAQSLIRI